jgi:hypothetical protein
MKNLWQERKIVSYPPLDLTDVIVLPVVVHRRLNLQFFRFCSEMALNFVDVHHLHIVSQASAYLTS